MGTEGRGGEQRPPVLGPAQEAGVAFSCPGGAGQGGAALRGVSLGTQGEAIQHWVCYTACDSRQREIKEAGVSKAE